MLRRIIQIDKARCNGCGLCAKACHEGAIGMMNGKAKLLREDYCDGLGDCLPACPMDAISFQIREAPAYDHQAVLAAKAYAPFVRKIEVEVENLDMVREAVEAGADIIMLDNMSHDTMKEAMQIIGGKAEVEVSGNVTKENIARITDLGVDYISSGALTHSAPILDLSLKNLHAI